MNFGYNIFNFSTAPKTGKATNDDNLNIGVVTVKIDQNDGEHPVNLNAKTKTTKKKKDTEKIKFVSAQITGKYKKFKDGDLVSFKLLDDLQVFNRFSGKETIIQGRGWIIDDRVLVDLGYDHTVIVLDLKNDKGIALNSLKNKELVLLKVITTK